MTDQRDSGVSVGTNIYSRPLLVIVAELVSLIGALGFLAAIAINIITFREWGIEFLRIATVSDVLMTALYSIWGLATAAFFAILLIVCLLSLPRTPLQAIALSIAAALALLGRSFGVGPVLDPLATLGLIVGIVIAVPALLLLAYELSRKSYGAPSRIRFYSSICTILVCALMQFTMPHLVFRLQQFVSPQAIYTTDHGACGTATILWIGERFSVARCAGASDLLLVRTDTIDEIAVNR